MFVHNADVHGTGMQIDATVELGGGFVVSHLGAFRRGSVMGGTGKHALHGSPCRPGSYHTLRA
jgi:hypothetical protein